MKDPRLTSWSRKRPQPRLLVNQTDNFGPACRWNLERSRPWCLKNTLSCFPNKKSFVTEIQVITKNVLMHLEEWLFVKLRFHPHLLERQGSELGSQTTDVAPTSLVPTSWCVGMQAQTQLACFLETCVKSKQRAAEASVIWNKSTEEQQLSLFLNFFYTLAIGWCRTLAKKFLR